MCHCWGCISVCGSSCVIAGDAFQLVVAVVSLLGMCFSWRWQLCRCWGCVSVDGGSCVIPQDVFQLEVADIPLLGICFRLRVGSCAIAWHMF